MVETGDKVTRKYSDFRGVDFRGDECGLNRSPDSLNVWRNYKNLASIETRPALEHIYTSPKGVRNMKWHNKKLYFLDGDGYLHALREDGTLEYELVYVGDDAVLFECDGTLYAKGSANYCNVTTGLNVSSFVPTTSIGRKPSGGGQIYQDVNMLSDYRTNTFLADGKSVDFYLDAKDIDSGYEPIVMVNGIAIKNTYIPATNPVTYYTVDYKNGKITFVKGHPSYSELGLPIAPPAPLTDGQDNVSITFKKSNAAAREKIMKCTIVQEFDNRVFFSGNPDYPSTVWHSSLSDPSYVSDLDYYTDGIDRVPIRSMVAGNNGLWVFRDETASNSSVFYHTPVLDAEYGKVYPSSHSSISLGCAGRAVNFNDDIVFFSRKGMESASTDITTEQFATHKSSLIDRKMLTNPKYKDMVLAEWEGYLLVFIGSDVYLADSRAVLRNEDHIEYEWYHWDLVKYNVTCAAVHDGVLYVGMEGDEIGGVREGHIYSFTRDAKDGDAHAGYQTNIESYWTTPRDEFGAPNKRKTTNKKGCVVRAAGDVSVYVKTDDDNAYELISTNNGVEDYFVGKIKRKKWKDIQLKFYSQTSFSLEAATLEAYVGGYIKR